MDKKCETFTFCPADYTSVVDHEEVCDENRLYDDIRDFIRLAIHSGYQMKIWEDGYTIIVEFNYRDESLSGTSLEWVGEDEYVEKITKEQDE